MGELTAVASANLAALGDFSEVAFREDCVDVDSSDGARGRVATTGAAFSLSDMASERGLAKEGCVLIEAGFQGRCALRRVADQRPALGMMEAVEVRNAECQGVCTRDQLLMMEMDVVPGRERQRRCRLETGGSHRRLRAGPGRKLTSLGLRMSEVRSGVGLSLIGRAKQDDQK